MAEEKMTTKKNFLKGIIEENPLLVSILGTCPALATTKTIEAAIGMGLLFTIVLICSSVLVSLLRKLISEEIRTPAYILIIATFVTIVKMLTNAFIPDLYSTLGVFISLIVVNCIVLGRAEAYASKHGIVPSFYDGVGMGIGFTCAITVIGLFRELIGAGTAFNVQILGIGSVIPGTIGAYLAKYQPVSIFVQQAGAFFVLAFLIAFMNKVKANSAKKNKEAK